MSSDSRVVLGAMICAIVLAASSVVRTSMAQNSPDDYVNPHNDARAAVGVSAVSWNVTLEAYAKNYANSRMGDCQMVHSNGLYGENLFVGRAGGDWTAKSAVDDWVKEQQNYDYDSNSCVSGECMHYTQVVWAASTSIGCDRVVCDSGDVFIICSYHPAGNVVGQRPY